MPQHPSLWSAADEAAIHVRRYARGELEHKLAERGFSVLLSTSYNCLLLPLMAASRWFARDVDPTQAQSREMTVSPILNGALRSILHGEVTATLAGMRWPIGGSRVVVAVKRAHADVSLRVHPG